MVERRHLDFTDDRWRHTCTIVFLQFWQNQKSMQLAIHNLMKESGKPLDEKDFWEIMDAYFEHCKLNEE